MTKDEIVALTSRIATILFYCALITTLHVLLPVTATWAAVVVLAIATLAVIIVGCAYAVFVAVRETRRQEASLRFWRERCERWSDQVK